MKVVWGDISKSRIRTAKGLLALALLCAFVVLYTVPPENLPFAACAFHSLTGHSCLTCGLTRSLQALLRGDLIASVKFHAMGPVLFLIALFFIFILSAEALTGRAIPLPWKSGSARKPILTLAIVWLFYCGVRLISELAA